MAQTTAARPVARPQNAAFKPAIQVLKSPGRVTDGIGEQIRFHFQALALIPHALRSYPGEVKRLLAEVEPDLRPLRLTRAEELRLLDRIDRIATYAELQQVQAAIRRNLGAELRIAPGPNEVRTVRGIVIVLEDRPGLCKKVRQSVPAARWPCRRCWSSAAGTCPKRLCGCG